MTGLRSENTYIEMGATGYHRPLELRATATENGSPLGRHRRSSRSFIAAWLVTFCVLVALGETWSLATPLGAAPDEPTQVIKAAAVVRGEWIGSKPPGKHHAALTEVREPATFANMGAQPTCYAFFNTHPAGCAPRLVASARTVTTTTYMGHYPPLYFLVVGWPSLVSSSRVAIYLMRLMSVVVNACFLAMAFACAYRWSSSRLLIGGLAIAVSPMVLFLSSVVNASSLEITAATAMWTAATVLVVDHPRYAPKALVAVLAVSTSVTASVRGLSPLWPVLVPVVLLPLIVGRVHLRDLFARRVVQGWGAFTLVAGVGAVAWVLLAHGLTVLRTGLPPHGASSAYIARAVIGNYTFMVRQSIGYFGWLDTPSPSLTYLIWIGTASAGVVIAAITASRRALGALSMAILTSASVPFLLGFFTAHHDGLISQGRYFMPLTVRAQTSTIRAIRV